MAWFKVDDRLHDHHKTRKVRRSDPDKRRDVAPFGLWTLAGSWCGENGTHGFIPLEILLDWDDDAEELADRLVTARLWTSDEVNGEPGYRFHDWDSMNPVDADDPSEYGRRGNHIRWHEKRGVTDPECLFCSPDDRGDSGGDIAPTRVPTSSRPDPTRPDPTRKTPAMRARELDTDPDFTAFWAAYPRRTDKGHARRAWLVMLKAGHDPATVIAGAKSFAATNQSEPKFTPHPATWLNGERWNDETAAAGPDVAPRDDSSWMRRTPANG